MVDDILTSPNGMSLDREHGRFGPVTDIRAPDRRGVRYDANGKFIGFFGARQMKFNIVIASVPDRENPVAEIWIDDFQFCELFIDNNYNIKIEIYRNKEGKSWNFDYDEFQNALQMAKDRLRSFV